ncbi:MAG: DUF177 domain-containing protein [Dehalobacterium sp.]
MEINVSKIKNISGKTMKIELKETASHLSMEGEEMKLLSPLEFSGDIENLGDRLNVAGEVHTRVELLCSRCMEVMSLEVDAPFSEIFSNHRDVVEEEQEEEIFFFEGDEIDIGSHVTRAILLELPMKALCKEECKGLCPECGVNLNFEKCQCVEDNIDPRFSALKKLMNQSSAEGGVSSGSTEEKNI